MPYAAQLLTAEDVAELEIPDKRVELVAGRLEICEPPGFIHGDVAARVLVALGVHLHAHGVGGKVLAESGYTLSRGPDTVRAPDASYISAERIALGPIKSFPECAPDLAVEVYSPGDRRGRVLRKIGDWLDGGATLVWLIESQRRLARVYRADGSETVLNDREALSGEDVLPGLSIPLASLFD